jgi:N-methylhydantoinase A
MRLAVDMGGTFTDLVLEDATGGMHLYKAHTVPDDPVRGILACVDLAADANGLARSAFLGEAEMFVHGTTRGLNAILTGETAKTAFVTTAGHRDILLFREGGRTQPFNHRREYPDPYVPRRLTYEVQERIGPDGGVLSPLREEDVVDVIERMKRDAIEAVGVCFLWSIVNPAHELRVGELLQERMPDVAVTLSHRLNPSVREYRRASSTCIDASLKPVMSRYLAELDQALRTEGFNGRLLIVSSAGGLLDVDEARQAPIHSLGSGPAMAPIAGRHFSSLERVGEGSVVVTDAGGTSFDVSLVRHGSIPWTRETWLGEEYTGDITGFPSVDVKSIGAGGGSIAWVDDGGLLHVGPQSAGADPGPACYGKGGSAATVTDACVALGYLDPDYFLGGSFPLDAETAHDALERSVGAVLGMDTVSAASAVLTVATEEMVRAIEETTVYRGVDPAGAVLVGGGGAAGFNVVAIAKRLGCRQVLIPAIGPGLSSAGALLSDLIADYVVAVPAATARFDRDGVNEALDDLVRRGERFASASAGEQGDADVQLYAEARYPDQVWELEVPVTGKRFSSEADVERLRQDFHAAHRDVFGVADEASHVEVVSWRARVTCRLGHVAAATASEHVADGKHRERRAYFEPIGWSQVPVYDLDTLLPEMPLRGPLLIESPQTTLVVYAGAVAVKSRSGNVIIDPLGDLQAVEEAA